MNMEKKEYMKPAMRVVRTLQMNVICASQVQATSTNVGFGYGGKSSNATNPHARSRDLGWDDEEW